MTQKTDQVERRNFLTLSVKALAGVLVSTGMGVCPWAFARTVPLKRRIALIIDDIGYSYHSMRRFLDLGIPLTFSVLPRLPLSNDLALEIWRHGHEIMLHQPMEPHDAEKNPGPGALYVGDEKERINAVMEENLAQMSFAVGVNNHMGSKFTEKHREMKQTLRVVQGGGLFFIDSLTTNHSVAYSTARNLGMASMRNSTFIDNSRNEQEIRYYLQKLNQMGGHLRPVIGIGHPHRQTARAIKRFLDSAQADKTEFIYVSEML